MFVTIDIFGGVHGTFRQHRRFLLGRRTTSGLTEYIRLRQNEAGAYNNGRCMVQSVDNVLHKHLGWLCDVRLGILGLKKKKSFIFNMQLQNGLPARDSLHTKARPLLVL